MKVPAEDREILREFVKVNLQMLEEIYPLLTELARTSGTDTYPGRGLARCFRVFHSMKGSAGFLQLDYFTEVAGAAGHLLVALQENRLQLRKDHADLLLATCDFAKFGLAHIKAENSDDLLAGSARELTERLLLAGGEDEITAAAILGADVTPERLEAFSLEADVLLSEAEQEFTLWDFIAVDQPRVTELFHTLHRLTKEFSGFGLSDLEQLSHTMKVALERFLDGNVFQGQYPEKVFLSLIDHMRNVVSLLPRTGDGAVAGLDGYMEALHSVMRQPLGELLVQAGFVETQSIEHALQLQEDARARQKSPKRLGEVLVDMGQVTPDQVSEVLKQQQSDLTRCK